MDEGMRFPDTVEEFMEQYKVVDREGIYMSKGSKLVPIFRMDQWFEHEKAQLSQEGTTKDATSDLISRQAAIDAIAGCTNCRTEEVLREYVAMHNLDNMWSGGVLEAIDAVKDLPSVQPEPERTMEEFMYGQDMGNPEDGSL